MKNAYLSTKIFSAGLTADRSINIAAIAYNCTNGGAILHVSQNPAARALPEPHAFCGGFSETHRSDLRDYLSVQFAGA